MEQVNIYLKDEVGGVITLLRGEAPKPINPERKKYQGNIKAVVDYVEGMRKAGKPVDPQTSLVIFNENDLSITLITDTHLYEHGGVTITAMLEPNPRLQQFGINSSARFTTKELEKLFSFNADMFSKEEHANNLAMIIAALRNFNAKVQVEIQESGDKRGNTASNFTKQVQTDIASSFVMVANVYKGTDYKKFTVDICYQVTDGGVRFWLESTELHLLSQMELMHQFSTQKQYLSEKQALEGDVAHGLVVITQ